MTDRAVEALRALIGETVKRRHEVAEAIGASEQNLYQIISGIPLKSGKPRGVGRQLRERLDRVYPGWENLPPTNEPRAHDVSQAKNYPSSKTVTWAGLPMADLSQPFELEVIDEAFGGDIPVGSKMRLDPDLKPRAGWPLLVKDKHGKYYLRDYERGPGETWRAVARVSRGFAPLDSEEHGLKIIAVMRGVDYYWGE